MFINQTKILEKLNQYLESKGLTEYDEDGFCNGLVALYLYQGKQWLETKLQLISNCDLNSLDDGEELAIEKFINMAFFLQYPRAYLPHLGQKDIAEAVNVVNSETSQDPPLINLGVIPFLFDAQELATTIRHVVKENQLIALQSSDHVIGLTYRDNKYYLYDPNGDISSSLQNDLEIVCDTPEELVKKLQVLFITSFDKNYPADNIPLAINIFCKKENYEKLKNITTESFKNINPTRNKTTINNTAWDGTTILHMASANNAIGILVQALNYMPLIDAKRGNQELTALMIGAANNYPQIVKILLENKSNPLEINKDGRTALHIASKNGATNVVKILLTHNAFKQENNINLQDLEGDGIGKRTALHYAAINGHLDIIEILIDAKANVNARDENGNTPLQLAIANGHVQVARYLMSQSAIDLTIENNDEDNALHTAINNNLFEMAKELVTKSPDIIFQQNEDGFTGVDYAIQDCFIKDNLQLIGFLFERIPDEQKYKAIESSLELKNIGLFVYLIDNFYNFNKDEFLNKLNKLAGNNNDLQYMQEIAQGYYQSDKTIKVDFSEVSQDIQNINRAILTSKQHPEEGALQLKAIANHFSGKGMHHIELGLYQLAAKMDPNNAVLSYNLGAIYQDFGEHQKAVEHYIKALDKKADDYDTLFNLAACHYYLQDYNTALSYLNNAAHLIEPNPIHWEIQCEVLSLAIEISDKKQDKNLLEACAKQATAICQTAYNQTTNVNERIKILSTAVDFLKELNDGDNVIKCQQQIRNLKQSLTQNQTNQQIGNTVILPPKSDLFDKSILQKLRKDSAAATNSEIFPKIFRN